MQWVTALRELKKLVEMFIYTGELHIKNQPKHRYEISQRTLTGSIFGCRTKRIPILPRPNSTSAGAYCASGAR